MPPKRTKKRKSPSYVAPKRRKGFLAVALPWLKRFGLGIGVIILITWLGAWFVLTGTAARTANWGKAQIIAASANAGFKIENLLVEGRVHTDPALMMALLNIQTGDPLFGINPQEAKALLEDTKWIRAAHIQRRLPDTLYIKLYERTPIALWEYNSNITLLDDTGKPLRVDDLTPFKDLISLKGKGADQQAADLIQTLMNEPALHQLVTGATRQGQRRWDLTVTNDITVKLPEDDQIGHALRRLIDAQENDKILDNTDIESLDMRFEDKIIIRTKPGSVIDYKNGVSDKQKQTHNPEGAA